LIQKLLIANRGEIACRIMRTCRRLGIRTVAVFSDADRDALHVATADEAVRIGPAEAAASYLDVAAVLDAAVRTGADAIHPGYGFLSERVALAEGCAERGLVWVGPSPKAIAAMGSKIESKRLAEAAGVPCVPGYHGADQDDAALEKAARAIGFPVLIKASAGGGGRGMRRVDKAEDLHQALALARAEAKAGFGDPALLIEKLIERPRHIEVQLAGDRRGNLVHLFERECSIQRNYQKIIEEAPAPNLAPATRAALFDAAIKLGRAIGYDSLGTVEFILDADAEAKGAGGPWFLEMNTRLQVEHPVTELITGLDLVEWQIRAAAGEALPLAQETIAATGWAIEARVNAEDPAAGYRPSFGRIDAFDTPDAEGVRVDTGIGAGSRVTPYYDSLLAKIIGAGPDRETAAMRLSDALRETAILGIGTNQAFLLDLVDSAKFRQGDLTTRFIAELYPDGWAGPAGAAEPLPGKAIAALAWVQAVARRPEQAALGPWAGIGGFRVVKPAGREARITLSVEGGDGRAEIALSGRNQGSGGSPGHYRVEWDGGAQQAEISGGATDLTILAGGITRRYRVAVAGTSVWLAAGGHAAHYRVAPAIDHVAGGGDGGGVADGTRVTAPLPGLVSTIDVAIGQQVAKGDTVMVIEAMKLMHALPAPASGRVTGILCQPGETVAAGAMLIEIEPEAETETR